MFYLSLFAIFMIAAFLGTGAVVVLRSRKYLRDESPSTGIADQAVCAECSGIFNVQNMIALAGVHVCARCKPLFLQKLSEGANIAPVPEPKKS